MGEDSKKTPKPMIEIGGIPIISHIMNRYSLFGINDFIICGGHKFNVIKKFFKEVSQSNTKENKFYESFNIKVIDTGKDSMTGGRLKRVEKYLENQTFCFTYGDTLNDVNIKKLIQFHKEMKTLATVTACIPPEKYGVLEISQKKVTSFKEKISRKDTWVNGGFFVLEPEIFDYIKNDLTIWEKEPLEKLAETNELSAYQHNGFYQHMDTIKEKEFLNKLWSKGEAKWKIG